MYVGETSSNTRIQVFSTEGEHLRWLGETWLNGSHDVYIDSNDTVYICDTSNDRICILDSNGTLLHSFGTKGNSPGQFNKPSGIAVDKNGVIYGSDFYNDHIQVF